MMFRKSESKHGMFVAIDFSGEFLKIAKVYVGAHRKEVRYIYAQALTDLDDDSISKILHEQLGEDQNIPIHAIAVVPSHQVITRNIELPSTDTQEISEIINLQASRYTPQSREDIVVDYINIATHKQSYTKALLIIVAKNLIRRSVDVIYHGGFDVQSVALVPESLAWAVAKLFKIKTSSVPVAMIHVDESYTDYTVILNEKVIFVRSIPVGAQHFNSDYETYSERFVEEIKRSLDTYLSEDIAKRPGQAVVSGAIKAVRDLEVRLSETLLHPVAMIPYEEVIPFSPGALEHLKQSNQCSFLHLILSVLARNDLKVNLIPEEIKVQRQVEQRGRELIKTGIYLLACLVLAFSMIISKIAFRSAYLQNLDKKYSTVNDEAKELEKAFEKLSIIREYQGKRGMSVRVLYELYSLMPDDVEVNFIRYEKSGRFSIRGTAKSMSTVFYFVDNMERSDYLKNVKTKYTAKRKDGLRDVTDFEITCIAGEVSG